jgi:ABC-type antimicrobial peptide transport system permease subunit
VKRVAAFDFIMTSWKLVPDAGSILVAVAASGLLAVMAGVVPALGLSRRPIAELIREPR